MINTSTIENEKWLVTEITEGPDSLDNLKAFFTCAFLAGTKHSREFVANNTDAVLEREWDRMIIILRGIITNGTMDDIKMRMKMEGGFDA